MNINSRTYIEKQIKRLYKDVLAANEKIKLLKIKRNEAIIKKPFYFASDPCGINKFHKELDIYKDYALTYKNSQEDRETINIPMPINFVGSEGKTSWFVWREKIKQIFYKKKIKDEINKNEVNFLEFYANELEYMNRHNELFDGIKNLAFKYEKVIEKYNKQIENFINYVQKTEAYILELIEILKTEKKTVKNKENTYKNKKIDFNFYDSESDPMPF